MQERLRRQGASACGHQNKPAYGIIPLAGGTNTPGCPAGSPPDGEGRLCQGTAHGCRGGGRPFGGRGHHPVYQKSVAGKSADPVTHGVVRGLIPFLSRPALNAATSHWVTAADVSASPQISPGRVSADHGCAQRGTAAAPDTGPGVAVPGSPGQD